MATWPVVGLGDRGENVRSVQYLLNQHGAAVAVDGELGPLTAAAVEQFQGPHRLTSDGQVGESTWLALIVEVAPGSVGAAVSAVQSQLAAQKGPVAVNGNFGPDTDAAVRAFQAERGLTVDGIAGPSTWNALVSAQARTGA